MAPVEERCHAPAFHCNGRGSKMGRMGVHPALFVRVANKGLGVYGTWKSIRNSGGQREGVHPPRQLYESQSKGLVKFAMCNCMKRKGRQRVGYCQGATGERGKSRKLRVTPGISCESRFFAQTTREGAEY